MKLTKRDIKKWVKALRSGEYKQGRSQLCKDGADGAPEFCCLGVACDLFLEGYWEPVGRDSWRIDNRESFPPLELFIAIDTALDKADGRCACNGLAGMNDSGASFGEIADHVEKWAGLR